MSQTFFERYLRGEHEQVWTDLLALNEQVRQEPVFSDAQAVARETMTRAKTNIDTLISRLDALGYQFQLPRQRSAPQNLAVRVPPPLNVTNNISAVERLVGPLPLSLRAWFEIVGGVSLVGQHEGWPGIIVSDPLEVGGIEAIMDDAYAWVSMKDEEGFTRPFHVVIAPDYYSKADMSGDTYFINLPDAAADAPLENERHNTTFVNYLRISLAWGGFPGFSLSKGYPRGDIAALTAGLLPL